MKYNKENNKLSFEELPEVNSKRWLSKEDLEGEEWRDVVGYEGSYMVSDYGRVKSLDRIIKGELHKGKILKAAYICHSIKYSLRKENDGRGINAHKLVAIAFVKNDSSYKHVLHKDGNWKDNRVENLYWSSEKRKPIRNRDDSERKKKPVLGVGINDIPYYTRGVKFYLVWKSILARCYSDYFHKGNKTYVDCEICDEWKRLSVFKEWFDENYKEGCQLDKDLFGNDSRFYSPETCCFIPQSLNNLLKKTPLPSGGYPRGVHKQCRIYYGEFRNKVYRIREKFDNPHDAGVFYIKKRAEYILASATDLYMKGEIDERILTAVKKYVNHEIQQADAA